MNDIEIFKSKLSLKELENKLAQIEQIDIPLTHVFSGGVYLRQIEIPKGSIIIGKRHRHETCNMLLKGVLILYMGENVPTRRIEGPYLFTSPPLTKKMAYCEEDAIFLNIHPTKETDLKKIENEFIITENEYENNQIEDRGAKCLGLP